MEKNIRFEKRLISFLKENRDPIELTVLGTQYKDKHGVSLKEEFPVDLQRPGVIKEYLSERTHLFHLEEEYSNGHLYTFLSLKKVPSLHRPVTLYPDREQISPSGRMINNTKYWAMVHNYTGEEACGGVWDDREFGHKKSILIKLVQTIKSILEKNRYEGVKDLLSVMKAYHFRETKNGKCEGKCSLEIALKRLGYKETIHPGMCDFESMPQW